MDFKFSKDAEKHTAKQSASGEKGRQNALLLLLLVLVCGYSYLYFFTGLIRPQQAPKPAEAPAPQVVKKPLPTPAGQPGTEAPPAGGEKKDAATPVKAESPKAVPGEAATAPGTPAAVGGQKADQARPAEKKAAPVPTPQAAQQVAEAKPEAKPAAAKKPATAPEKKPAAVGTEKKAAGPKSSEHQKHSPAELKTSQAVAQKPAKKPVAGSAAPAGKWTVVVGNYILEDAMATDLARVRKAGFKASVQPGVRKKAPMNRLFLAEFADRHAAQAELEKLKRYTSDAFIVDQGDKHAVYAGSYLLDSRAASEKERLAAAGLTVAVRHVEVPIPSKNLITGVFADKGAAETAVRKLKEAGLSGAYIRQ
ncbi:SPOR domain-containing protein [Geobacter sp. SVR]|uniref:SPOR domain-containing protein n=1 Tax=Geobacter sp. SVR TaxID=2495594 RepID=UPI00143F0427|nr:SPOR domain-containing protein [Geobacter sp. SVR]BCS53033.1 SPOR domain-containing protein [Geobacter sp. SVR]GCF84418.1 hypothetical protein GSbR_10180 [Geobacter sp. SVR]